MPNVRIRTPDLDDGLNIEFDQFGDPSDTPVLLIMGLGYQMIEWDERFCVQLAARGLWVTRYDNRDVGLSTHLDELETPDVISVAVGAAPPPYTLEALAEDAVGLLDALHLERVHVVGISMGGMVAQLVAISHPERVLSLTSVMSTVGGPGVVQPEQELLEALLAPVGATRADRIENSLTMRRLVNGGVMPFDDERQRARATTAVDRSFDLPGVMRQLAAILAAPARTNALQQLRIPALVIHGSADPLVPPDNGRQTAAAIPDARLLLIPGMGHNVPEPLWPEVLEAIGEVIQQGESAPATLP